MPKFRLLSAAAVAALGASGDPATDGDAGPEPGQGGSDAGKEGENKPTDQPAKTNEQSDAGSQAAETPVDVVAAADVADLTAKAEAKGFAAANARMKAVFDSPEGKANAADAAFLLATSNGSADDIIGHLKGRAPAPAPAATTTIPDTTTDIKTDAASLAGQGASANDVDKSWDDVFESQAAAQAPLVPPAAAAAATGAVTIPARAIPRTGN